MGTDVDAGPPVIEISLELILAVASDGGPEFAFEGSVEPFDLALGLRVIGTSMDRMNAQSDQAGIEPTEGLGGLERGPESVVAEDGIRQPELAEGLPQNVKGGLHRDIGAGVAGDEIARVVINHSEGMDLASTHFQRAFVIALPELMRTFTLKGLHGVQWFREGGVNVAVSLQNLRDGSRTRNGEALLDQISLNLSRAPTVLPPHATDGLLDRRWCPLRRGGRLPRLIRKRLIGNRAIPRQPLGGGLSRNTKIPRRLGHGQMAGNDLMDESEAKFGHG